MLITVILFTSLQQLSTSQTSPVCGCLNTSATKHRVVLEADPGHTGDISVTSNHPIKCPLQFTTSSDLDVVWEAVGGIEIVFRVKETWSKRDKGAIVPRKIRIKVKNAIAGTVKSGSDYVASMTNKETVTEYEVKYVQDFSYNWPSVQFIRLNGNTKIWYIPRDQNGNPGTEIEAPYHRVDGYPGIPYPPNAG